MLKTRKANKFFMEKNYEEACILYKELSKEIGYKLFQANIKLCEKKLFNKPLSINTFDTENNINVAFITDINYAMATYVAITTIIKNININYVYSVYIFAVDMKKKDSDAFYELETENVKIYVIDSHKSNDKFLIQKNDGFHVSPAAIVKFELASSLSNIDKVLYLDGDIVVQNDLVDLYHVDLPDEYAAVVEDMKPKYLYKPSILKKLNIESHDAYFNSGVMLLNLSKLRKDNVSQKLYEYREHGKNFFMDQDAFNVVFKGKVKYLHPKNNFLTTNRNSFNIEEINSKYPFELGYKSYSDAYKTANIIHFSSKHKPWNGSKSNISKLWFTAYALSGAYGKFGVLHNIEKTISLNDILVSYTMLSNNLHQLYKSIISILSQSLKPKNVVLWVSKRNFPLQEGSLPNDLLELKKKGLIIEWCIEDKPCNRLVNTIKKYKNETIINAEEDTIYPKDWLLEKVSSYLQDDNILIL